MLLQKLNRSFRGSFDFLYLPMDFESSCNMGYAFLNFRTVDECERFTAEFDGVECRVCLPGFSSAKVCRVSPPEWQAIGNRESHGEPIASGSGRCVPGVCPFRGVSSLVGCFVEVASYVW